MTNRKDLQFMGRMTAGLTHEINNVLAIIRESSGLMQDMLSLGHGTDFQFQDKFSKSLSAIESQIERGVLISTTLNQFSHAVDKPLAHARSDDIACLAAALNQRGARLLEMEIIASQNEAPFSVATDVFRAVERISLCVTHIMGLCAPGTRISICQSPKDRAILVKADKAAFKDAMSVPVVKGDEDLLVTEYATGACFGCCIEFIVG